MKLFPFQDVFSWKKCHSDGWDKLFHFFCSRKLLKNLMPCLLNNRKKTFSSFVSKPGKQAKNILFNFVFFRKVMQWNLRSLLSFFCLLSYFFLLLPRSLSLTLELIKMNLTRRFIMEECHSHHNVFVLLIRLSSLIRYSSPHGVSKNESESQSGGVCYIFITRRRLRVLSE